MLSIRNAAHAAIAFACLSAAAAGVAAPREPGRATIAYADLNLSSAAGRATLDRRVHRAIAAACDTNATDLAGRADAARCRAEMTRDGRTRVAALFAAEPVRVASIAR